MSRSVAYRYVRLAVAAALVAGSTMVAPAGKAAETVLIEVLSNRADLISGGNARVAVALPISTDPQTVAVDVDGRDVTSSFAVRPNGRFEGLVTGLGNGANVLTARLAGGSGARITIRNEPIGGPVLAGPQIQPWTCAAGALDAQCNRAATYRYLYKSTAGGSLRAYDPASPPPDVAQTTSDNGETVPFIVREEKGVLDRDEYRVAVLFDPAKAWEPWAPQPGFNHKLVITHGASCDTSYAQGTAPDVLNETALSRGFAVMSHALDNAGHNCNIVTQGESLVMTKEHVVETLGDIRYTIGSGCSGGSLVQLQLANAFPGLYQGILPQCSYPDAWSSAMQYEDYHLIREYFENPSKWEPGVAWGPVQMAAINGHPNPSNPITFTEVIPDSGYPNRPCPGVPDEDVYDAESNPDGVRCTFMDYMVNVFGRRASDGFAGSPWDNTGVQYGLRGLLTGKITPAQFVDINSKIGGRDIDHNHTAARVEADAFALDAAYRSGAINSANNLDEVAIIDLRGPDPGAFHDVYRTYALRARLEREHGDADNHLVWRGFVPLIGDANFVAQGIVAIDQWLAAVEADSSATPLADKIVLNRPATVADRCTNGAGTALPSGVCDVLVESYTTPRIEAGMPFTDDVMKCQLKPMRRSDYYPAYFSDAQWAELGEAYPNGVCDYSKPGISQQGAVGWQTYQDASGNVIYGGTPLGPPPQSVPVTG